MFSHSIEKMLGCIKPVVACKRLYNGSVLADGGTLVVVNRDGWFVSAAHVFEVIPLFKRHLQEIKIYEAKLEKLKKDPSKEAKKELAGLKSNPEWITASSVWPGSDDQEIVDINVIPEADILVGRLTPFDPESVKEFPVFKNPKTNLSIGTSLCKIGFAFAELKTFYDAGTNKFSLDFQNLVPFPIEGIYTRNIVFKTSLEKNFEVKFLETSSPGLKGQSGGPVFDVKGRVWAIQSSTAHIPLGFNPRIKKDGKEVEENQFLNVSWAVHPDVVTKFFIDRGIGFQTED